MFLITNQKINPQTVSYPATYDPNDPNFGPGSRTIAITDMTNGEVKYGSLAFEETSRLQSAGFHEGRHVWQFKNNKVVFDWGKPDPLSNRYALEVDACRQTLKNAWKLNLTNKVIQEQKAYLIENQIKASWRGQGIYE